MMEDFNKDMREYFQNRKITPSENAWERMQKMLEDNPKAKKKKYHTHIFSVAASIMLLLGFWFWNKGQNSLAEAPATYLLALREAKFQKLKQKEYYQISSKESEKNAIQLASKKNYNLKENQSPKENYEDYSSQKYVAEGTSNVQQKEQEIPQFAGVNNKEAAKEDIADKIKVDAKLLLRIADIERHIDDTQTGGQNFWRKIKEINTVVENNNLK